MPGIVPFADIAGGNEIDSGTLGGGGNPPAAPVPDELTDLVTDESGTLAVPYGLHAIRGTLILSKRTSGPPPTQVIFVALGEGPFDGVEALYYAGELLDPSTYHFHPGTLSSGTGDPVQGVDSFFSGGLTYNKTAYVAVNLPEKYATEERPDKLIGIYRCLKVPDYDYLGNVIDAGSYSNNPARCAADAMINRAELPITRVDWESWELFKVNSDTGLTWDNDGDNTGNLAINSFDCNVAFLGGDTDLATALDIICATAAAIWQDDGEKIGFTSPFDQEPTYHFSDGSDGEFANIIENSFSFSARELKDRPNYLKCTYRDQLDPFLAKRSEETTRDMLQDRVGLVDPGAREFATMTGSQAQRLLERQMRIESDNPILAELKSAWDSISVLAGDWVTVSHAAANWLFVKCIVIETVDESIEDTPDVRNFILQRIDGVLYDPADQRPQQPAVTP